MATVQDGHGGGCCGMLHIYGFNRGQQERDLKKVQEQIKRVKRNSECRLIEIVLTDPQIKNMPELSNGLKRLGFKLKTRFLNINSGNYCNVLHWTATNELHGSPYWKGTE